MTPEALAPVVLEVAEAFRFESLQHWVNKAQSMPWTLEHCSDGGKFAREVCVDAQGRVCRNGDHFMRANTEGAFPVVAYRIVRAIPAPAKDDLAEKLAPTRCPAAIVDGGTFQCEGREGHDGKPNALSRTICGE